MPYLIGTDPELFLKKKGKLTSAFGLIKGDKANPFVVDKGAVQVDGMALEFNTDPTDNEDVFVENIAAVMSQLQDMVPDYEFYIEPTAEFGKKYIAGQPTEATEMGCDPDFNAYTGKENPKPDGDTSFRTASGHIHIGWTEGEDVLDEFHFDECCEVAKQLDAYLGVPSLLFDKDSKRREMYGKAGAFRPKPYGMEYRVLSNAWLKHPDLQRWVFKQAQKAVDDLVAGKRRMDDGAWAKGFIDHNDNHRRHIEDHLRHYNIDKPPVISEDSGEQETVDSINKSFKPYEPGLAPPAPAAIIGDFDIDFPVHHINVPPPLWVQAPDAIFNPIDRQELNRVRIDDRFNIPGIGAEVAMNRREDRIQAHNDRIEGLQALANGGRPWEIGG